MRLEKKRRACCENQGCGLWELPAFVWRTVIKLDLHCNETLLKVGRMTGWKVRSEDKQIKGGRPNRKNSNGVKRWWSQG